MAALELLRIKGERQKIVLVTGSSRGIGFDIASRFLNDGHQVILNGRNEEQLKTASKLLSGTAFKVADVSEPLEAQGLVDFVIKTWGRLDVLVCNVGDGRSVPGGKETLADWQKCFNVNLWSVTNMVESALNELEKSKGCIVCISSICGMEYIQGAPVTYSVAKAALNAYVKASSVHLGKKGIRINAIAPGNIIFEGSVWERKLAEDPANVEKMLTNCVPLSRLGKAHEVSEVVNFLASSSATFVTGTVWKCDGGQTRSF